MDTPASERVWVRGLWFMIVPAGRVGPVANLRGGGGPEPLGPAPGRSGAGGGQGLSGGLDDGLGREAVLLEEGVGVGRGAVVLERDGAAVDAEVTVPRHRDPGLHADAGGDGRGQHGFPVGLVLLVEPFHGRHRDRRVGIPWASSCFCASAACCSSEPVPIRISCGSAEASLRTYAPLARPSALAYSERSRVGIAWRLSTRPTGPRSRSSSAFQACEIG